MALFDATIPANSEAVKLGAQRIREVKSTLNTALGQIFNDDTSLKTGIVVTNSIVDAAVTTAKLADGSVTTPKLADGVLPATAAGHAKVADGFLSADSGQTSGLLVSGRTYVIHTLAAGDDFANIGYTAPDVNFVATGTTPAVWTNSTRVFDVVKFEGQAKMQDGFLTANTAGRAKMEDGYLTLAKLASGFQLPTVNIAPGAITNDLINTSLTGLFAAAIRWTGNPRRIDVSGTPSTTSITVVAHGLVNGTGDTDVPAVVIILGGGGGTDDALLGTSSVHNKRVYYTHVLTADSISLHATPADALAAVSPITTTGIGVPRMWYFPPAQVYKRGCSVVPLTDPSNSAAYLAFRIAWHTPFDSDIGYVLQVNSLGSTATGMQNVVAAGADIEVPSHVYTNPATYGSIHATAFK